MDKPESLENTATNIFLALVFLLPLFFLPLSAEPFAFSKAILFYFGVSIAFIFWLVVRFQKGEISFPKSILILSIVFLVAVWLLASIFSINKNISLMGYGFENGTFFAFLFFGIATLLISLLFQSNNKVIAFYFVLFTSALIVFIFQILHTVFGISIFSKADFSSKVSNLIGGWNDFAAFFGFIALSALVFFELLNFKKPVKMLFLALIIISLIAMASFNFYLVWYVLGAFILAFLIYSFFSPRRKLIGFTFFVFLLILFFILSKGILGDLTSFLGTNVIDVRLTVSTTYEVVLKTLKDRPFLGSGPNTFVYDWLKFKPLSVNVTDFWNVRFQSGFGQVPSFFATAGIAGGLAIILFLACLIYCGLKAVSYVKNDLTKTLLMASSLGSIYLWTFAVLFSPSFLILALSFMTTGILIALLIQAGKIKTVRLSFLKNAKINFFSSLLIIFLLSGTVFGIYLISQKYRASFAYAQGLKILQMESNLDKAEEKISKAAAIDKQDIYFRALSEIRVLRMQSIASEKDVDAEILLSRFQNELSTAIQYAKMAADFNPSDPLNWIQAGRVYELIIPLNIEGAKNYAIENYKKALEVSPQDASLYLALAIIELQTQNETQAREYLEKSINLNPNYSDARYFLGLLYDKEGKKDEAIKQFEKIKELNPDNQEVEKILNNLMSGGSATDSNLSANQPEL